MLVRWPQRLFLAFCLLPGVNMGVPGPVPAATGGAGGAGLIGLTECVPASPKQIAHISAPAAPRLASSDAGALTTARPVPTRPRRGVASYASSPPSATVRRGCAPVRSSAMSVGALRPRPSRSALCRLSPRIGYQTTTAAAGHFSKTPSTNAPTRAYSGRSSYAGSTSSTPGRAPSSAPSSSSAPRTPRSSSKASQGRPRTVIRGPA
mmetsp:Transcript_27561/g.92576  ORF Transcript_27561/g.92576 Transcript_27561/m.92576 type:complete len:207 (+) Transcript_27561:47-667(+)